MTRRQWEDQKAAWKKEVIEDIKGMLEYKEPEQEKDKKENTQTTVVRMVEIQMMDTYWSKKENRRLERKKETRSDSETEKQITKKRERKCNIKQTNPKGRTKEQE